MNRRRALKLMFAAGTLASIGLSGRVALAQAKPFTLPPLGYPFEALEPHIDAQTMRIPVSYTHLTLPTIYSV